VLVLRDLALGMLDPSVEADLRNEAEVIDTKVEITQQL
jgi:hypothetical protein